MFKQLQENIDKCLNKFEKEYNKLRKENQENTNRQSITRIKVENLKTDLEVLKKTQSDLPTNMETPKKVQTETTLEPKN